MGEITQEDRRAAEAIIDDLTDRKGLRHEFDNIDVDIQDEIKETWAGICARHRELGFREGVEVSAKVAADAAEGWRRNPSVLNEEWNQQDAMRALEADRIAAKIRALGQG